MRVTQIFQVRTMPLPTAANTLAIVGSGRSRQKNLVIADRGTGVDGDGEEMGRGGVSVELGPVELHIELDVDERGRARC
jgi:hypothetical protein